ncbi:MAG: 30S ribosomal protein S16 [Candidatus Wallbacteria bacterium]|nr:30S ribosomal protein S16 [Candidatus Wallbacteria bacterium]MBI4867858.1 30S ribosomal protein S16 [Candidatus Wallbacteria bacterium]
MATAVRLRRVGTHKKPFYRIVATDSRNQRDGAFIENLGIYHPMEKPATVQLNEERLRHYAKVGARFSETVKSLCKQKGLKV